MSGVARTARRGARGGMTLLELLLAVTIMASVMGLIGALMGQAQSWTERSATDQALLRLQRVGEALRAQWADRRTAVSLGEEGQKVLAGPESVEFLTATPLLFPDWPLVVARYTIEADTGTVSSSGLRRRLVYEETRLSGMEGLPEEYALDGEGRSMRDRLVLLEGMSVLRWERFGRDARLEEDEAGERSAGEEDGARAEEDWARRDVGEGRAAPGLEERARRAGEEGEEEEEGSRMRWREFVRPHKSEVPAVRLVGEYEGERFVWVLVVRALR